MMEGLPMRALFATTVLLFVPMTAIAIDWNCRNTELEIQCAAGQCAVSQAFTPVDISVDSEGTFSVCAYSACWQGPGSVVSNGRHLMVAGTELVRSGVPSERGGFMVGIDTLARAGFLWGEGFALPVSCTNK
jgi:hypothetical protein